MQVRRTMLFWLCAGWTAFVWSTLAWQTFQFSGLFRWLAEWQLEHWGQYRTSLTLLIVGFTLTGPALHWLGCDERRRQKEEALNGDPAAKTVRARRFSFWMTSIATFVAMLAFARLQQFPSSKALPVEIDLATLGSAEPPLGNAILIGKVDTQSSVTTTHTTRTHQRHTAYFPVHPKNDNQGPIRFFVERTIMTFSPQTQAPTHFFPENKIQGALVRNGLPGPVRIAFEKSNIRLAENCYLLTTASSGGREPYIVASILGTVVALSFLIAAVLQTRLILRIRKDPSSSRPEVFRGDF